MIEMTPLEALGYLAAIFTSGFGIGFLLGTSIKSSTVEAKCSETVYSGGIGFQVKYTKRYNGLFSSEILCEHINKKKICDITNKRCKYI